MLVDSFAQEYPIACFYVLLFLEPANLTLVYYGRFFDDRPRRDKFFAHTWSSDDLRRPQSAFR